MRGPALFWTIALIVVLWLLVLSMGGAPDYP